MLHSCHAEARRRGSVYRGRDGSRQGRTRASDRAAGTERRVRRARKTYRGCLLSVFVATPTLPPQARFAPTRRGDRPVRVSAGTKATAAVSLPVRAAARRLYLGETARRPDVASPDAIVPAAGACAAMQRAFGSTDGSD